MNRNEWKKRLNQGCLILDGATGSNLVQRGMPSGVCPEQWIIEHPDVLIELQREFVEQGSQLVYAATFGANRNKLVAYGLEDRLEEINTKLVEISKQAVGEKALVAADISMNGKGLFPLGPLHFDELVELYKEQITILEKAGVDVIGIETMMSLEECRAAVIAAREVSDLPVMVSMTFDAKGRTLYGTEIETAVCCLQALGADAVGINCSEGPDKMLKLVRRMKAVASVPIIVKPNAGRPKVDSEGFVTYDMDADAFTSYMKEVVEEGVLLLGGCCGTTPEYIAGLKKITSEQANVVPEEVKTTHGKVVFSTERKLFFFDESYTVGHRIDASKNSELAEELMAGDMDMVFDFLEEEADDCNVIEINVDAPGTSIQERISALQNLIEQAIDMSTIPFVFASESLEVLSAACRYYPGITGIRWLSENSQSAGFIADQYGCHIM